MAGWRKIVKGMVGTGLTFGVGIGSVTALVILAAILFGNANVDDLRFAGKMGVVGTLLGVGFSAILALSARSRKSSELSIRKFSLFGAAAGLVYFLLISTNAYRAWTLTDAISNLLLLTTMGAAAATATLLVARKARPTLPAGKFDGVAQDDSLITRDTQRSIDAGRQDAVAGVHVPGKEPVDLRN